MQRGGSDYLNDGCRVWGVSSDSWAHCLYGQLEDRGRRRRNAGTKGWFGVKWWGEQGWDALTFGHFTRGKDQFCTHTRTHTLTAWDRAWHLKGKSWHWLHHCHLTAIKQLQILKHFSSVPLGVIGTRNCFALRLLLACSAAALPRDSCLLTPPHNILAVDVKLSMYTCHSQSLYRLPLSLCTKTLLPPCLLPETTHMHVPAQPGFTSRQWTFH